MPKQAITASYYARAYLSRQAGPEPPREPGPAGESQGTDGGEGQAAPVPGASCCWFWFFCPFGPGSGEKQWVRGATPLERR